MHKEVGGEEKEESCVIIPSCAVVAAEEELSPLLLCWLLGGDAGKLEGVFGDGGWGEIPTLWGKNSADPCWAKWSGLKLTSSYSGVFPISLFFRWFSAF